MGPELCLHCSLAEGLGKSLLSLGLFPNLSDGLQLVLPMCWGPLRGFKEREEWEMAAPFVLPWL